MTREAHLQQLAEARSHIRHTGRPIADRLWDKVAKGDGCWEWQGSRNTRGYGVMRSGGGSKTRVLTHAAHRVSYELAFGPIPAGMFVCHKCDNPPCVRPEHLYLGSPADNTRDREQRGRNGVAKVTATQVIELRKRRADGQPLAVLAADYGLSISQVSTICTGRVWREAAHVSISNIAAASLSKETISRKRVAIASDIR